MTVITRRGIVVRFGDARWKVPAEVEADVSEFVRGFDDREVLFSQALLHPPLGLVADLQITTVGEPMAPRCEG